MVNSTNLVANGNQSMFLNFCSNTFMRNRVNIAGKLYNALLFNNALLFTNCIKDQLKMNLIGKSVK